MVPSLLCICFIILVSLVAGSQTSRADLIFNDVIICSAPTVIGLGPS